MRRNVKTTLDGGMGKLMCGRKVKIILGGGMWILMYVYECEN
jgi:hypothetical protein